VIFTSVDAQEVQAFLDDFAAGKLESMAPLKGGLANSNYRIDRHGLPPLVLRIWNERDFVDASRVTEQMARLAEYGVPTPAPIRSPEGACVARINDRAWILMPFVEGHWLKPNVTSLGNLGRTIGTIALTPSWPDLPAGFPMGISLFDRILAMEPGPWSDTPFMSWLQGERDRLMAELPPDLPRGVVHGDIFPDNLIASGNEIVAVIDFEEICCEALVLDLAMAFVGCGWQDEKPSAELWDALIDGYESVRPLSDSERNALRIFHRYATVGIAAWRFWQFNINRPSPELRDYHRQMVDRLQFTEWF
jgi:homoserine kinase type II